MYFRTNLVGTLPAAGDGRGQGDDTGGLNRGSTLGGERPGGGGTALPAGAGLNRDLRPLVGALDAGPAGLRSR